MACLRSVREGLFALALACLVVTSAAPAALGACDPSVELLITELQASNGKTLADEDGDYSDWIEIYDPCLPSVNLDGWFLTDDPAVPTKWRIPAATLARDEFVVVFASGKNRAVAGSEFHTNFKLSADGEYLALVKPDGLTVAQQFAPQFPLLPLDFSYGLPQTALTLVSEGAAATWLVPASADSALGTAWTATGFDDSAWMTGTTGLGFAGTTSTFFDVTYYKAKVPVPDLNTAEAVIGDPATQSAVVTATAGVINYLNTGSSAHYGGDSPFPSTTIGSDVDDFVVLVTGTIFIPSAGPWTFGVNSDDGFSLELTRDPFVFTSSHPSARGPGDTLSVFNIVDPGTYSMRLVFYERGGGSELELFAAQGSRATFDAVNFHLVGNTAAGGLAVVGFGASIATNIQSSMQNVNATLWTRLRFDVADLSQIGILTLRMKYEDGFVAYLNGQEVARRNAPGSVQWDSAAASDRLLDSALVFESIDLTDSAGLLQVGTNVLAIQGLNDTVYDSDFLLLPQLSGVSEIDPAVLVFFSDPTPGIYNTGGFPGISGSPQFSHASAIFLAPFSLTVTASAPGAVIRYTLDGSDPTLTQGTTYAGPIAISTSSQVRARVFETGLAPSPIISRYYAWLAPDVLGFSSNLPIVVVDTFGAGIATDWFTPTLTAIIDSSSGRATILDVPGYVGSAGIKLRGSSSLSFPKKQYALETWDEERKDLDVPILGFPPQSDWILYAPYSEKSLMQNPLAYQWSNDIGRYAVRTQFAEMFLRTSAGDISSADYVGVYAVMEKIKGDPNRVAIQPLQPTDNVLPQVSGGYILKKDRLDPGDLGFLTSSGQRLAFVEPKESEITPEQSAYIRGYMDSFETVLFGPDFANPAIGYATYIDVGSFIDHHILVETFKNIDGFRLSTFMFKDRGGKLNMGPIWDYNLSLGNANYLQGGIPTGWYYSQLTGSDYPWYGRLFQDPEFEMQYADRWFELRRGPFVSTTLVADIDGYATLLDEAQLRNFARWPILGVYVWPNYFIGPTYASEVDWMRQFLLDRLAWMDAQFVAPPVFNHAPGTVPTGFNLAISAPSGVIYFTLDGSDPRLPGGGLSPSALIYTSPLVLTSVTHVRSRTQDGTVWSAQNDATFEPIPIAYVNEVLPLNAGVLADELGGFDPWIELYNPSAATADLGGLYLTNDLLVPDKWLIPAGTKLCGLDHLIIWADSQPTQGALHASFSLSPSGGSVGLFDGADVLLSVIAYPSLTSNTSYGRLPDGSTNLVSFLYPTPLASNTVITTPVLLNEYNGVALNKFLTNSGSDAYWGRILGNGGDWFELVIVKDHLDLRGWKAVVRDNVGSAATTIQTLTFTGDSVLSDLRSGTILTVSEDLASDVGFDPPGGDWWINLRSGLAGDGIYISALDFIVSNTNTQVTLLDAAGRVVFGPAGEGIFPASGIGSDEVFKLEQNPGPGITPYSSYNDGTSSTFGSPNAWSGGLLHQDFTALRAAVTYACVNAVDCQDGDACTDDACSGGICANTPNTAACDDGDPCTANDICANRTCLGQAVAGCCAFDCACDDANPCTDDSCSPANGCVHSYNTQPCDDADTCTTNDACNGGACSGGPLNCDDGSVCTLDTCSSGQCQYMPSGQCRISGTIRYYRTSLAGGSEPSTNPVPGISLDATQDALPDAVTDGSGVYALENQAGSVTVATLGSFGSPRVFDPDGAISSFDAVLIARWAVGVQILSANQQIAADVTGNGQVTSFDAAQVAQLAVELIDHFDVATASSSDWRFLYCDPYLNELNPVCGPAVLVHDPLTQTVADDFYGILYGDVSGNWVAASVPGPALSTRGAPGSGDPEFESRVADRLLAAQLRGRPVARPQESASRKEAAMLSLQGWNRPLPAGATRKLQVRLERSDGIHALDLVIRFDPAALSIDDISLGDLASGFSVASACTGGSCRAGLYGVLPLEGSGSILTLTVRALKEVGRVMPFAVSAEANEGGIALVAAPPRREGNNRKLDRQ